MRPPSFKMEVPADDIIPPLPAPATAPAMPAHHHDPLIEVNELPPAKFQPPIKTPADSDETEYSTSFADTTSTDDNNSSALSDAEVDSKLDSDANAFSSPFDEFGTAFRARKKKLTSQWRSFIRPVMWRCKWAELKVKQFESQALKYAKTIAAHDRAKHLANQSIPEGFSSRSMPFTCQRRSKLMKRRKRVRVEDTIDAKLYMSKHILFSYHESRKSDPDGISMTDDFDDPVFAGQNITSQEEVGHDMHNNLSFLEDKDNDMEHILRKIDIAQTRVHKLKAQLDLVISENVNHLGPFEAQTSTVRSPTFSTCNGDTTSAGGLYASAQHISELDMGDSAMPEHAVSSYGEGFHIPDIIESTVGLPSSVDVTHHQSQVGDSCENIVDNLVVHNQAAEAERHTFRNCQQQAVVKQEGEKSEEEESTHPGPAMESDTATKDGMTQEQSSLKSSLARGFQIPKNKRKRGERKAGTGNWSRQCPGEHDSQ